MKTMEMEETKMEKLAGLACEEQWEEAGETDNTTQGVHSEEPRLKWHCPITGCDRHIEVHDFDAALLDFFIVHHLAAHHGYSADKILAYDKRLTEATDEYIGLPGYRYEKPMP